MVQRGKEDTATVDGWMGERIPADVADRPEQRRCRHNVPTMAHRGEYAAVAWRERAAGGQVRG
jgi:hypothetical protein